MPAIVNLRNFMEFHALTFFFGWYMGVYFSTQFNIGEKVCMVSNLKKAFIPKLHMGIYVSHFIISNVLNLLKEFMSTKRNKV